MIPQAMVRLLPSKVRLHHPSVMSSLFSNKVRPLPLRENFSMLPLVMIRVHSKTGCSSPRHGQATSSNHDQGAFPQSHDQFAVLPFHGLSDIAKNAEVESLKASPKQRAHFASRIDRSSSDSSSLKAAWTRSAASWRVWTTSTPVALAQAVVSAVWRTAVPMPDPTSAKVSPG